MRRVCTIPFCALSDESFCPVQAPDHALLRLTGVDAPLSADTLHAAERVRIPGCAMELSVSDRAQTEGDAEPPEWISMVWIALKGKTEEENAVQWELARRMHDGKWPVGIQLPLSAGTIRTLPGMIGRLARELPELRALCLIPRSDAGEPLLNREAMHAYLLSGLTAVQRALEDGWKCIVRCEGLPLCAADVGDYRFFPGRNEREEILSAGPDGSFCEASCSSGQCRFAGSCSLAPYGECRDHADDAFWIPEPAKDHLKTPGLYTLCGEDERFAISRYTDVRQSHQEIVMRSRLFGTAVKLPLRGVAQDLFLDRLSAGMTSEEILTFFRGQDLDEELFHTMLRGCVLA